MKNDEKMTVSNSLKDVIGKVELNPFPVAGTPPRLIMSSKTVTNPDGSKDYIATCVSSELLNAHRDPEIKGVVLRKSNAPDVDDQIKQASGGKSLDEVLVHADDETYALEGGELDIYGGKKGFKKIPDQMFADGEVKITNAIGDKGVIVRIIPDDQIPTNAEGVEIKGVHLKSSKCNRQGGCGSKGCRNAKD